MVLVFDKSQDEHIAMSIPMDIQPRIDCNIAVSHLQSVTLQFTRMDSLRVLEVESWVW